MQVELVHIICDVLAVCSDQVVVVVDLLLKATKPKIGFKSQRP